MMAKKRSLILRHLIFLSLFFVIFPNLASAEMRFVVNIPGIAGDSVVPGHEGWIDAISYKDAIGAKLDSEALASVKSSWIPSAESVAIAKMLDKASPKLHALAGTLQTIPNVEIRGYDTEDSMRGIIWEVKLKNVRIIRVQTQLANMQGDEFVFFSYGHIQWTYGGAYSAEYDIMKR